MIKAYIIIHLLLQNPPFVSILYWSFFYPESATIAVFGHKKALTTSLISFSFSLLNSIRFDAAIGILRERNLVKRYNLPSGDYLRTRRALQRTIHQGLDTDLPKRQSVFDEVITIAQKAFPVANIIMPGDTSQYTKCEIYAPSNQYTLSQTLELKIDWNLRNF